MHGGKLFMRNKFFLAILIFTLILNISLPVYAAPSINTNGDPHVGAQTVLSVSEIPAGGSAEWSITPTGLNPARFSLRAGGRECSFIPLDTKPINVSAIIYDRSGNVLNDLEYIVKPAEFKIKISVENNDPVVLWDSVKRSNRVLDKNILMAKHPIKLRAELVPGFDSEHNFKWTADPATGITSAENDIISITRNETGESEIYVTAFNSTGTKLGTGSSTIKITLPLQTFEASNREREAYNSWTKAQELWNAKNYAEAVKLATNATKLSPRDEEINNGFKLMSTNFNRFTRATKLRQEAKEQDSKGLLDEALKNLRSAQIIWPVDDGEENISIAEKKVDDRRILLQKAEWLRDKGAAYDKESMFEDALECYAQSVALVPSDAITDRMNRIRARLVKISDADKYAGEGITLEREGKLQEALEHYGASLVSNPDAGLRAHIEELQSVIKRREDQSRILYREGMEFQRRGNNTEALKRYRESLNLWETENAVRRANDLGKNIKLGSDVVLRSPEDFGIGTKNDAVKIVQEADKLYSENKISEAIALYKKAQSISPSKDVKEWLDQLEKNVAENEAVNSANEIIKQANNLYRNGKLKEAIELYKKSLEIHRDSRIEEFIKANSK